MNRRLHGRNLWLLVPGLAVSLFAVSAIVLPVGSDGLGAGIGVRPGLAPTLARWARDIHDGFWRGGTAQVMLAHPVALGDRARAIQSCERGQAEQAVALYKRIGVATEDDRGALFGLAEYLITDGNYERCEWYVKQADHLLGGGTLRNNLAWHYSQTNQRLSQALDLALMSVAEDRDASNVDTLAWVYYRLGEFRLAKNIANETLAFHSSWLGDFGQWSEQAAKESSRKLLARLDAGLPADAPID